MGWIPLCLWCALGRKHRYSGPFPLLTNKVFVDVEGCDFSNSTLIGPPREVTVALLVPASCPPIRHRLAHSRIHCPPLPDVFHRHDPAPGRLPFRCLGSHVFTLACQIRRHKVNVFCVLKWKSQIRKIHVCECLLGPSRAVITRELYNKKRVG